MTPKRAYYGLLALLILLMVAVLGSTYGVNALLSGQSNKLVSLKTKLAGLNQQQTDLSTAKNDIAKYSPLYNIAKVIVPENKDQAETVRQIVQLAARNGVNLASITFPSSSLGASTTTTNGTSTTTVATGGNPALSQLVPVPKIPGVYNLQITVASATTTGAQATYPQFIGFLSSLENNRQTALVSSISIEPNAQDRSHLSFTLTLNIYIKPGA
jgi:hypothetical protein